MIDRDVLLHPSSIESALVFLGIDAANSPISVRRSESVRDVAEIYGGSIHLEESEDLGGLLARLTLPAG